MTTPPDTTNTTERDPRPSGSPPDEPRRASSPERQRTMPPRRTWLWFVLLLLANFLVVRLLFPGPEAPISGMSLPGGSTNVDKASEADGWCEGLLR